MARVHTPLPHSHMVEWKLFLQFLWCSLLSSCWYWFLKKKINEILVFHGLQVLKVENIVVGNSVKYLTLKYGTCLLLETPPPHGPSPPAELDYVLQYSLGSK